jgi:hypothetical protein
LRAFISPARGPALDDAPFDLRGSAFDHLETG